MTLTWAILAAIGVSGLGPVPDSCQNPQSAWTGTVGARHPYDTQAAPDGAILVAGRFDWIEDFDPTYGVDERVAQGESDAFVTKVYADGTYAWTYTAGGLDSDAAAGVCADVNGHVFVGGTFQGTVDFDPTNATDARTAIGDNNVFVVRLAADGAYLSVLTFGQGNGSAGATGIALDGLGNTVVVGSFFGTADFDPSPAEDLHTATPVSRDIFVTKLAPDGTYLWTGTMGGTGYDRGTGIAVDSDGNIFVTGTFRGTADFDPGPGVDEHSAIAPFEDVFITKLHPDGSYGWTRTYDPGLGVQGGPIAVDADGAAVITGAFMGTVDLDPTEGVDIRSSLLDTEDIFVTKIHGDGSYAWTHTVGGPYIDRGHGVAVDPGRNVYATGEFWETVDFDPGPLVDLHTSAGNEDIFVTMLSSDGSYQWARTLGGSSLDHGQHATADANGGVIAVGTFRSYDFGVDFDPGCELDEHHVHIYGIPDTFIMKLVCVEPTADFDDDGDVDLLDFARFQVCFTGEGPAVCRGGCNRFDLDPDDDIDLFDFAAFTALLNGPSP
jgi:hypothetical protein